MIGFSQLDDLGVKKEIQRKRNGNPSSSIFQWQHEGNISLLLSFYVSKLVDFIRCGAQVIIIISAQTQTQTQTRFIVTEARHMLVKCIEWLILYVIAKSWSFLLYCHYPFLLYCWICCQVASIMEFVKKIPLHISPLLSKCWKKMPWLSRYLCPSYLMYFKNGKR